ncbi:MAG: rhamnogalacturonan acetylesterase [Bacteroidales bacterium]|nr:rhamnogalacturonan acetylesterase [Bacteroidales bacterium]
MKLRTMTFLYVAVALLAGISCSKEQPAAVQGDFVTKTLDLGFEASEPASKTYLVNNAHVNWSTNGVDKIVYVFDTEGNRYDFTSTATTSSATRSFSCDTWPASAEVKMVLWSGKTSANEKSVLNGWTLSGESLAVKTAQGPNMSNSFDATVGIAVMKPGDAMMRSVLGYLRYRINTFPGGSSAAIKSVTVSADEDMAGKISIDYSGAEPVASIVSDGVKSITANTRFANKNGYTYEPGYVYVGMLPGTYHNVKLTITAFAADPDSKDAATIEPFTIGLNKDLTIVRGQYTDVASALPNVKPETGSADTWPSDASTLDYGLQPGEARTALYDTEELADYGVTSAAENRTINKPVISNCVTYGGPGLGFYGNRMVCEKVSSWSTDYPNVIPANCYMSFRINRPGSVKFYGAPWGGMVPTFYLAVVKTVNGGTSASIVQTVTPSEVADASVKDNRTDSNVYSDGWAKYWNTLTVSAEDIAGIDEPATVYLYHSNATVHYWPLVWISSESNPVNPASRMKFLLASDSTCRTNSQSEYPRAGWGQYLAQELGNNADVMNLAVGGRSTKSFITNGHWAGLLSSCNSGDVVVIQFGHNDAVSSTEKHTALDGSSTEEYQGVVVGNFQPNLRRMVNDVLAKGGIPILSTSTSTRNFDSSGHVVRNIPGYIQATRDVASEMNIPLIDINELTCQWLESLGKEGSEPYFVTNKLDPSVTDNSHLTHEGAQVVARMVADGIKALGLWQ